MSRSTKILLSSGLLGLLGIYCLIPDPVSIPEAHYKNKGFNAKATTNPLNGEATKSKSSAPSPSPQNTQNTVPITEKDLLAFILSGKKGHASHQQLIDLLLKQEESSQRRLLDFLAQQMAYSEDQRNQSEDLAFAEALTKTLLAHSPQKAADFLLHTSSNHTFHSLHKSFYEQWSEEGIGDISNYLLAFSETRTASPDTALHLLSKATQSKDSSRFFELSNWVSSLDTTTHGDFKYDATLTLLETVEPENISLLENLMADHLSDKRMGWLVPKYVGQHLMRHSPKQGLQWLSTLSHGEWTSAIINQAFVTLGEEKPYLGAQVLNEGNIADLVGLPQTSAKNKAYFEKARNSYLQGVFNRDTEIESIQQYLSVENRKAYQKRYSELQKP